MSTSASTTPTTSRIALFTIGFTQKSAERFFGLLEEHGIERVVDIRLHPSGQLAGFAKQDDLRFFLRRLLDCDYVHQLELAPSEAILSAYRADHDNTRFLRDFAALLDERGIPGTIDPAPFAEQRSCLLCSEAKPDHCHRRVVAERLAAAWPGTTVTHLV